MCNMVQYKTAEGDDLTITAQDVRNVLCGNQNVTDKEVTMFLELCKANKLNPFVKDAYIIKYGNSPAQIVPGKDLFLKRATRNRRFQGYNAGVTICNKDGVIERRKGSMYSKRKEYLIGGWAEVYLEGYQAPIYNEVSFEEYAGRTKDGNLNSMWTNKPGTMIRKVALSQALREAFPEDLGGLYEPEEMAQAYQEAGVPEMVITEAVGSSEAFAAPVVQAPEPEYVPEPIYDVIETPQEAEYEKVW